LPRTHPLVLNQPWTLAHPSLLILLKTQTRKTPKSSVNVKGGIQSLMISRTSFMNHIAARGIYSNSLVVLQPDDKPPSTYKCLWCKKEVRVSGSSLSNICTHCDGSRQTGRVSDGCPQCQKAIEKGAKLPVTSLQESKTKRDIKEGSISNHFNQAEKFDNETLKNIISLWLLRQAIPWNRIEDLYLQAAFHYCGPGSIFSNGNGQQPLGNRFGFIGASVSFINNDWNYVFQHLYLKLFAWNKGSLLAEPIVNILAKHGLQRKISNNSTFFTTN
ncbi:hypothetical protein VP01_8262g1, partial [Puccinia sorghi]